MSNTYEQNYPVTLTREELKRMAEFYETGVSMGAAAEEFGYTTAEFKAVRKVHRLRKDSLEIAGIDYAIDADMAAYITAEIGELIVEGGTGNDPDEAQTRTTDLADENPRGWDMDGDYVYNADQDTYVFFLRSYADGPYVMDGEEVRRFVRAYSDYDGNAATINQISTEFRMPRSAVKEIKTLLGVTHDSPPRTPEEFESGDVDEMVSEDVLSKRRRYGQEYVKEDWRKTRKEAELFRKQNHFFEKLLNEHIEQLDTGIATPVEDKLEQATERRPGGLLVNLQDLHIGKRPSGPLTYTLDEYCQQIYEAFKRMLGKALNVAYLDEVKIACGGDLSHVDNARGETTRGTPQDLIANPAEIAVACEKLIIRMVDLVRRIAGCKAELIYVDGNHDSLVSKLIFNAVMAHFRGVDEEVVGSREYAPRQYVTYGEHLLLVTHGDMSKKQLRKIANLMLSEARELISATQFQTVHTGHLHQELVMDDNGLMRRQAPSPSATDRWHDGKGYTGNRRCIQGILMEPDSTSDTAFSENLRPVGSAEITPGTGLQMAA